MPLAMKTSTALFTLILVSLISNDSLGQSQPSQPKRDPAVVRTSVRWQLPDDRRGVRTAPILLMSRDDVADDLGLTPEQRAKTWEMIGRLGNKAAELKGRKDDEALKLRREIDQMQLDWLKTELNGQQLSRLTQIDLQWEGPSAILSRPQVSEAMHLTADQKTRISTILQNAQKITVARPLDETLADLTRQVFATLDETQQQAWRSLTGPELGQVPRTASTR
ncbi:MAG: hypothetical protein RJA81_1949 [Planctomycetota bacterium]